jgi:hypothetical protein
VPKRRYGITILHCVKKTGIARISRRNTVCETSSAECCMNAHFKHRHSIRLSAWSNSTADCHEMLMLDNFHRNLIKNRARVAVTSHRRSKRVYASMSPNVYWNETYFEQNFWWTMKPYEICSLLGL